MIMKKFYEMIMKKFNENNCQFYSTIHLNRFKAIYKHVKFLNFWCSLNDFYIKSSKCH